MLLTQQAQRQFIERLEGASCVTGVVRLRQPAAQVFEFIATPAQWPRWHSSTRAVRSAPFAPLLKGDSAWEQLQMLGRRFDVRWTVVGWEPSRRFSLVADGPEGVARITYAITPDEQGCVLARRMQFRSKPWAWHLLDRNLNRYLLQAQSDRALNRLKRVLERSSS